MPWDHCDVEFLLDDEPCTTCGVTKAAWSIQVDKTRVLKIGRKRDFTLRDFGEALRAVHEQEGLIVARRLAEALDYDLLVSLCERWRADPAKHPDDDPNAWVHPRYLLLPWMDDALIPEDARAGLFEGDHAGPVLEMCQALARSGVECPPRTVFDDDVLRAWRAWRTEAGQGLLML